MKKIVPYLIFIILTGCYSSNMKNSGQVSHETPNIVKKVIKVIPGFVLIDTDKGLGKIYDSLIIQRKTGQGIIDIGIVQILKFKDGKTATGIINEEEGLKIQEGDFVKGSFVDDKYLEDLFVEANPDVNPNVNPTVNPDTNMGKKDSTQYLESRLEYKTADPVTDEDSPCNDPLYLALKSKSIGEMTDREYKYFLQKDKECTEYQKIKLQMKPSEIMARSSQQSLESLEETTKISNIYWIGVLIISGMASFILIIYYLSQINK